MKNKDTKLILVLAISVLLVLAIVLFLVVKSRNPDKQGGLFGELPFIGKQNQEQQNDKDTENTKNPENVQNPTADGSDGEAGTEELDGLLPWEVPGAKLPEDYTWREYEMLTVEQQAAFREYMGNEGFAEWTAYVQSIDEPNPWELPGAIKPEDYTMEDFEALTEPQREAFLEYLGPQGLEAWLNANYGTDVVYPWDKPGAKKPQNYTWNDYQKLTAAQKLAFRKVLGESGFQAWMNTDYGQKVQYPWDKLGAKRPQYYTLDEYNALTEDEKRAFKDYLGTKKYEEWLEWAKNNDIPWEKEGAKQPEDYTWDEYDELTESQKVAFQEHLEADGFSEWMTWAMNGANPWHKPNAKQPKDYTWKEYKALTSDQKVTFEVELGTNGFKAWLESVATIPWNKSGAKKPEDYTWDEYQALTEAQKLAFRHYFGTERFEEWKADAQTAKEGNPWEKSGAKQPKDYTMKDFEALTVNQQMAFQKYLGEKGFEDWLDKVQGNEKEQNPWEKPGAKQPKDYTMAEFEALTTEQQMAFQAFLGEKGFETWLNKVQGNDTELEPDDEKNPWEKPGAKQPKDYTMAEFEALTPAQQMAFQNYLGEKGFEEWLNKVQSSAPEKNPWDEPGAKQPNDYTMAEFEALTPAQQMAFQNYLGEKGFEEWLNRVQSSAPEKNPWDEPGAKQPNDYTMAEFEALSPAQQIAFQNYLGEAGFEAWLNRVTAANETP